MAGKVTVVVGSQWGDEGKGKLVDLLATKASLVCRCQGGHNAGHTVVANKTKYDFHILPSGVVSPDCIAVIGNGVVVHLPSLFKEIDCNAAKGLESIEKRLKISSRAHIVFDLHQIVDHFQEQIRGSEQIGTTKRGIGPTYSSKATRNGLRIADLVGDWSYFCQAYSNLVDYTRRRYPQVSMNIADDLEILKVFRTRIAPMVCDTASFLNREVKKLAKTKKLIIVEVAQSAMLDIDFGTYPCVTSSNSSVGGACTGLGIPPTLIGDVFGVFKAYTTRVGVGPFPTEVFGSIADHLQSVGKERGTTTNRRRRVGWIDLKIVQYATLINGFTALALTKLDVLSGLDKLKVAIEYRDKNSGKEIVEFPASIRALSNVKAVYKEFEGWIEDIDHCKSLMDLPQAAQDYVEFIQKFLETPIRWISVGQDREETICL